MISIIIDQINKEGKSLVFLGDFNVNLLDSEKNTNVANFIDTLCSHLILPAISLPTRITNTSKSLIDNILISPLRQETYGTSYYKDCKNFDKENFMQDFRSIDWNSAMELERKNPDFSFSKFYEILSSLVKKYVPLKRVTNKQYKARLTPWITKGIKASIYQRNKYHNLFLRTKDSNKKTIP